MQVLDGVRNQRDIRLFLHLAPERLLIGFAGLVMTIGVVTTDGDLLLQGVLMMGASGVWWLRRQVVAAKQESRSTELRPEQ